MARDDFRDICLKAVQKGGHRWSQVRDSLKNEVRSWEAIKESPQVMLGKVEAEMLDLNSKPQTQQVLNKEKELQRVHSENLAILDIFWHQRSRVSWAQMGDRNTNFFHVASVVRHRRNQIRAIQREDGSWETSDKGIRRLFVEHFRDIYAGSECTSVHHTLPADVISRLPKVPDLVHTCLVAVPGRQEI